MRFNELPGLTKILGDVKLFVDLTRLSIAKVVTGGPTSSQGPSPLLGVVGELVNFFA